ncbi:hypothetical protein ACTFIW_012594 [Dictyostelium discoideum]
MILLYNNNQINNHFDENEIEKGMKEINNNNINNNKSQNIKNEMYTIKKKEIIDIKLINDDDNNNNNNCSGSKESSTSSTSIISLSSFFSNINNIYDEDEIERTIGLKKSNKIYNNTIIYRSTSQHKNLIPLYEHYYKVSKSTKLIFTTDQFDPKVDIDNDNLIVFAKGLEPLIQENFEFYCSELIHLFEILKKYNANNMKILLLSLNSQYNSFLNSSLIGLIKYFNNNNNINNNNQFISIDFDNNSYYNNNIFNNIELIMMNFINYNNINNNNINNNNNNNIIQIINNKIFKEYNQIIDENFNNKNKIDNEDDKFGKTVLITGQEGLSLQFLKWIINKRNTNIKDIIVISKSSIDDWEIEKLIEYCTTTNNKLNDNKITIHFKNLDISKMYSIKNLLNQIYKDNNNISPVESIFHFSNNNNINNNNINNNNNNNNNFKKFHECSSNGSLNLHQISIEMKWNLKTFLLNGISISNNNNVGEISSNEVLESLNNYRKSIGLSSSLIKWSPSNIYDSNNNNNNIEIIEFLINNKENYSNISIL